jgi:hypothetical protein
MIKCMKKILVAVVVGGSLLAPGVVPAVANAQIDSGVCEGANLNLSTAPPPGNACTRDSAVSVDANKRVNDNIKLVINVMTLLVGVVAVIMIIIGGFKYITSGGDSSRIASAKDTILFAIIGLVVVVLAQVIVRFVISRSLPKTTSASQHALELLHSDVV